MFRPHTESPRSFTPDQRSSGFGGNASPRPGLLGRLRQMGRTTSTSSFGSKVDYQDFADAFDDDDGGNVAQDSDFLDISMAELPSMHDRHRYPTSRSRTGSMASTTAASYDTTPLVPLMAPMQHKIPKGADYRHRMIDARKALLANESGIIPSQMRSPMLNHRPSSHNVGPDDAFMSPVRDTRELRNSYGHVPPPQPRQSELEHLRHRVRELEMQSYARSQLGNDVDNTSPVIREGAVSELEAARNLIKRQSLEIKQLRYQSNHFNNGADGALDRLKRINAGLEAEIQNLKLELSSKEQDALSAQVGAHTREPGQQDLEQIGELHAEIEHLNQQNLDLNHRNEQLQSALKDIKLDFSEVQAENEKLHEEHELMGSEKEQTKGENVQNTPSVLYENQSLSREKQDLLDKLELHRQEAETFQSVLNETRAELQDSQLQVTATKSSLKEYQLKVQALELEVVKFKQELKDSNSQLETSKSELEDSKQEIVAWKHSLEVSKSELEVKKTELETEKSELETIKSELEASKQELKALNHKLIDPHSQAVVSLSHNENSAAKEIRSQLAGQDSNSYLHTSVPKEIEILENEVALLSTELIESIRRELGLPCSAKVDHSGAEVARLEKALIQARQQSRQTPQPASEEVADLKARHAEASHVLELRSEQCDSLMVRVNALEKELKASRAQTESRGSSSEEVTAMKQLMKQVNTATQTAQSENETLRKQLSEYTGRSSLAEQLESMREQRDVLQDSLRTLRERKDHEIERLRHQLALRNKRQSRSMWIPTNNSESGLREFSLGRSEHDAKGKRKGPKPTSPFKVDFGSKSTENLVRPSM